MKKESKNGITQMNNKEHEESESNEYKKDKKRRIIPVTYRMSYVLGGLYLNESIMVVNTYMEHLDWQKTRSVILAENRLQSNMKKSSLRMYREIEIRLRSLNEAQLKLFSSGTVEEKRQLLWLACCKSYRLMFEMATELFEEKAIRGEKELTYSDYDLFYTKKALKSEKLQKLRDTTQKRLRNVTFKIMREADIINKKNEILPQLLTKKVQNVISDENPQLLKIYQ